MTLWLPINFLAVIGLHGILVGCEPSERYSFGGTLLVAIGLFTMGIHSSLPPGKELPLLVRVTTSIYFIAAVALLLSTWITTRRTKKKGGRLAKWCLVAFLIAQALANTPILLRIV